MKPTNKFLYSLLPIILFCNFIGADDSLGPNTKNLVKNALDQKFKEFKECMSWDRNMFFNMLKDGWIVKFRERKGKQSTLYELGYKGKRVCASIYKILNKEEIISEDRRRNPMFKNNTNYGNKVYRKMIIKMNKEIKGKL